MLRLLVLTDKGNLYTDKGNYNNYKQFLSATT